MGADMAFGRIATATALVIFGGMALAQTLPMTPELQRKLMSSNLDVFVTDPGGRLPFGSIGCVLVNNVWDPKSVPAGFSQSVSLEWHDQVQRPGWRWTAPGNGTEPLSMPEIVCGDKPWDTPRELRPEFPFQVGNKTPVVTYDIDLKAKGTYNLTFSLWAVSALPAVKNNISLEIVVWNVAHGLKIDGDKIGTFAADGTTYDLYLEKKHGVITGPDPFTWPLVQFVAREPKFKGTLDFGPFLSALEVRGLIKHSDLLTSVELGTEVAAGQGELHLKSFAVGLR
jgi:hypothetical protein